MVPATFTQLDKPKAKGRLDETLSRTAARHRLDRLPVAALHKPRGKAPLALGNSAANQHDSERRVRNLPKHLLSMLSQSPIGSPELPPCRTFAIFILQGWLADLDHLAFLDVLAHDGSLEALQVKAPRAICQCFDGTVMGDIEDARARYLEARRYLPPIDIVSDRNLLRARLSP